MSPSANRHASASVACVAHALTQAISAPKGSVTSEASAASVSLAHAPAPAGSQVLSFLALLVRKGANTDADGGVTGVRPPLAEAEAEAAGAASLQRRRGILARLRQGHRL